MRVWQGPSFIHEIAEQIEIVLAAEAMLGLFSIVLKGNWDVSKNMGSFLQKLTAVCFN